MRKAQTGVNAAILVAIISTLIIVYIIFLPESEKRELLLNKTDADADEDDEEDILLREFPGTLSKVTDVRDERTLPNIFLIETTNAKELAGLNPFIVKSNVFSAEAKSDIFFIDDVENTDNVVLTFVPEKHEGVLTIRLNGNNIYEKAIISETIDPIRLNKRFLDSQNTLEFSVAKPGFAFWRVNEYSLDNIRIIGDITDKSRQKSQNVFTLTSTESNNIEEAVLKFIPYCSSAGGVGVLDIELNSRNIFSAVPVCDDPYRQDIPTGLLKAGENNIVFKTNKGSYSVEQIVFDFDFEEPEFKTYFFEINKTEFKKINDTDKDVILSLKFADDTKDKDLRLNINGHLSTIDTRKDSFSRNINDKVIQGNNFVRLTPLREDVDVVEIKVELVED